VEIKIGAIEVRTTHSGGRTKDGDYFGAEPKLHSKFTITQVCASVIHSL
jgi:hypothetical protein